MHYDIHHTYNQVLISDSAMFLLFSLVSPQATLTPDSLNLTLDRGDMATLQCISEGGPNNTYQWLANEALLPDEVSENLTLSDVVASVGGTYTCLVSNLAGNDTASTMVYIFPYIEVSPGDEQVSVGATVELTCIAEAFPNPVYLWKRADNGSIRDGINTSVANLSISSIEYDDYGGYYCAASALGRTDVSAVAVITGMHAFIHSNDLKH